MARTRDRSAEAGAAGANERRRGIVLLDIVLTLAVLLLSVRVVWPLLQVSTSPARLTAWSHEIAALIEADRVAAARRGRLVETRIDVRDRLFLGGARGQAVKLPRDVVLDVVTTADCSLAADRFAIGFAPDGRSCGLTLSLRIASGYSTRVSVNWLTGLVDVTGGGRGRG